jgi:hypothetical protein
MATIGVLLIFVHAVTKQIEVWPVVPVDGLKQAAVYLGQKLHHLQAKITIKTFFLNCLLCRRSV